MTNDSRCPPMLNYEFRHHRKPFYSFRCERIDIDSKIVKTIDHRDNFYRMMIEIYLAVSIPMLHTENEGTSLIIPAAGIKQSQEHIWYRWNIHNGNEFAGAMWQPCCEVFEQKNGKMQCREVIYDYTVQADNLIRFLQDYERNQVALEVWLEHECCQFTTSKEFEISFDAEGNLVNPYRIREPYKKEWEVL